MIASWNRYDHIDNWRRIRIKVFIQGSEDQPASGRGFQGDGQCGTIFVLDDGSRITEDYINQQQEIIKKAVE